MTANSLARVTMRKQLNFITSIVMSKFTTSLSLTW